MRWKQLLIQKRARDYNKDGASRPTDLRSEFEKDYHRIIGSASFRRLQDKTQVFPLDKSDFIRTRLTHSLEVASLGKSLGQTIGESIISKGLDPEFTAGMKADICHIVECAGLIHDIGNPPFGHFGETAIREWFVRNLKNIKVDGCPLEEVLSDQMINDFTNFEGNAQALRLVTRLHYLVDEYGMNLTYPLLNTIIKYPVSSDQINRRSGNIKDKKMGYFYADEDIFLDVTEATGAGKCRHPLTFILEAADDLAYKTADIEDAFVKGYITYDILRSELVRTQEEWVSGGRELPFDGVAVLDRLRARGDRQVAGGDEYAVRNWLIRAQSYLIRCATEGFLSNYDAIMSGWYKSDLFSESYGEKLMEMLGRLAFQYVFSSKDIYRMEVAESVIIDFLMNKFVSAALDFGNEDNRFTINSRCMAFISDNYKAAYNRQLQAANERIEKTYPKEIQAVKKQAHNIYLRLLLVTDYICGMTDSYAKRLYQEMNGIL